MAVKTIKEGNHMNITTYCASSDGDKKNYIEGALEFGKYIAESGSTLIYGGGKTGLMGAVSKSVIDNGGHAIGVITYHLKDIEGEQPGLDRCEEVETMAERKTRMIELGDAFVALPGGPGTLEEISEIISAKRLDLIKGPCILFNQNGFYNPLKEFLSLMVKTGFYPEEAHKQIYFSNTIEEIIQILEK